MEKKISKGKSMSAFKQKGNLRQEESQNKAEVEHALEAHKTFDEDLLMPLNIATLKRKAQKENQEVILSKPSAVPSNDPTHELNHSGISQKNKEKIFSNVRSIFETGRD